MFERRLKLFLVLLCGVTLVLLLRAAQVQVLSHADWSDQASRALKQSTLLETTRGSILDIRGREMAVDQACTDACVDYRAILPEPDVAWVQKKARARLLARVGTRYRRAAKAEREAMLQQECAALRADIGTMWTVLAKYGHKTPEEMDDIRRAVVQKVEMRRRYAWYERYRTARQDRASRPPSAWYKKWLLGEGGGDAPPLDSYSDKVGEMESAHVMLPAVPLDVANELGKSIDRYPGLELRPGTHRVYPYKDVAAHVVGHLSRVSAEERRDDPYIGVDELRSYALNDLIGRTGLEALCEPALRGTRGRIESVTGEDQILTSTALVHGANVTSTLDMELQADIQNMFAHARTINNDGSLSEPHPMHGAAVVIDVATGEVRALVSYPTFDVNLLDEQYAALRENELDKPLLNRATQAQLEPGSTVKPVVGIGAITQGVVKVHEGIECTGHLVLHGREYKNYFRCWVASQYERVKGREAVRHHPFPYPHQGSYGNPDGFLIFADALERSCNVYFETLADRLGMDGLHYWFDHLGLGRRTGVGIAEAAGRIPDPSDDYGSARFRNTVFSGIGQGPVAATPIQMANVAASIARNGVWMRPLLVKPGTPLNEFRLRDASGNRIPDRVDLKLAPESLAAAREGMTRVVNNRAGTGIYVNHDERDGHRVIPATIAAKTGTAQAARFSYTKRDRNGHIVRDEQGRPVREFLKPSTTAEPNPQALWYRLTGDDETKLDHAWVVGFAPAEKPQIAFAVMVEYGGSGGRAAAPIARGILEKCVEHGYLALTPPDRSAAAQQP